MQSLGIVLVSILAAVLHGIVHDQITARICVEYFTIGHPPVFNTDDPTLLAIGWGTIATSWVGAMLGVPLAIVAGAGSRPKRDIKSLIRPIAILMIVNAIARPSPGQSVGSPPRSVGCVFPASSRRMSRPTDRSPSWPTSRHITPATRSASPAVSSCWRWFGDRGSSRVNSKVSTRFTQHSGNNAETLR